jgi:integrase
MHFITMAKKAGLDEYAIKYIVGHAILDLTERVYTQRSKEWLKEEIEKIKGGVGNVCRNNVGIM